MHCYLLPAAIRIEPVKVGGDGCEAGGGTDLAAEDGAEAGDAGEGPVGIADHEGSAGVAVAGAHAAGGVDADNPVPVEGAVVLIGHRVVENGHGDLVDDVGHSAVELVAGLAPTGHVHRLADRGLPLSQGNGANFAGELQQCGTV